MINPKNVTTSASVASDSLYRPADSLYRPKYSANGLSRICEDSPVENSPPPRVNSSSTFIIHKNRFSDSETGYETPIKNGKFRYRNEYSSVESLYGKHQDPPTYGRYYMNPHIVYTPHRLVHPGKFYAKQEQKMKHVHPDSNFVNPYYISPYNNLYLAFLY